jgi:hemoglobin
MKTDLTSRRDTESLVNAFYGRVRQHVLLGPIFDEVAQVNWQVHLPKMYSFWSSILLGEGSYHGNAMQPHLALSRKTPLTSREFSEWRRLFDETVDELFEGPVAEEAKSRAAQIAGLMQRKVEQA